MSRVVTVRGPLPSQMLAPGKTSSRFSYRRHAEDHKNAFFALSIGHRHTPPIDRFELVYRISAPSTSWSKTVGKCVKRNHKPYCAADDDNVRASCKHAVDGLVAAGVVRDDKRKHLIRSRVEVMPREKTGPGYLELVVIELNEGVE